MYVISNVLGHHNGFFFFLTPQSNPAHDQSCVLNASGHPRAFSVTLITALLFSDSILLAGRHCQTTAFFPMCIIGFPELEPV